MEGSVAVGENSHSQSTLTVETVDELPVPSSSAEQARLFGAGAVIMSAAALVVALAALAGVVALRRREQ